REITGLPQLTRGLVRRRAAQQVETVGEPAHQAQRRSLWRRLGRSLVSTALHAARAKRVQTHRDRLLPGKRRAHRPEGHEGGDGDHDHYAFCEMGKIHERPHTLIVAIFFITKMPKPMLRAAPAATIWPASVKNSGSM